MNRKNNTTIGLDIAKNVFHYAQLNRNGTVTGSGKLKRNKVLPHFAGLESSKVVMEACAGSHYWGRQLQDCNHEVILLPAHKVTPYVQGNKNDKNDALAISEAASRPGIRIGVAGTDPAAAQHRWQTGTDLTRLNCRAKFENVDLVGNQPAHLIKASDLNHHHIHRPNRYSQAMFCPLALFHKPQPTPESKQ